MKRDDLGGHAAPRTAALALLGVLVACGGGGDSAELTERDHLRLRLESADSTTMLTLASGDTLRLSQATVDFYRRRRFRPAWQDEGELLPRGIELHRVLASAENDGLNPEWYAYPIALTLRQRLAADEESDHESVELSDSLEVVHRADLDIALTEGFNRYATDLARGTIDPRAEDLDWRIPHERAHEQNLLRRMVRLVRPVPPAEAIALVRPAVPHYTRFMRALEAYRAVQANGGWPQVPEPDDALSEGDSSAVIVRLRERLVRGADSVEATLARRGAARPAVYDADLARAVERFQDRHAIEPDGTLGPATLRELNHTVEERIAELRLNLDRWRWLPQQLGERFVLVNVAGFELEVIEDGRTIEAMNVVVGQQNWRTPIFADTMEFLIVNPYWNVPASILKDEILPALARDPAYLARNDMERTANGGVRQRPGPKNALGKYKFMFPNADNIYLHDTPAGHLFSRTRRDFSHGCIRVERPEDLARLVMRLGTRRDPDDLARLAATTREQWVRLDNPIPIYILYFTAWVKDDGAVRFHHDIYGRDERLQDQQDKLQRPHERAATQIATAP
ncbi:MAG: L,D-transpeptidase family protein [Longimicrobiales bacterium]